MTHVNVFTGIPILSYKRQARKQLTQCSALMCKSAVEPFVVIHTETSKALDVSCTKKNDQKDLVTEFKKYTCVAMYL